MRCMVSKMQRGSVAALQSYIPPLQHPQERETRDEDGDRYKFFFTGTEDEDRYDLQPVTGKK